jgi:hypothetical protein
VTPGLLALFKEVRLDFSKPETRTIYILTSADEIVYIGQTGDLQKRLSAHRDGQFWAKGVSRVEPKEFDRVFTLSVPVADVLAFEGALIRRFSPRYCDRSGRDESRDAEILRLFDLEPCPEHRADLLARRASRHREKARRRDIETLSGGRVRRDASRILWKTALRVLEVAA